ncbi:hypothetical protein [Streptomyces sp. NPDC057336]|uniref:hypothetical protein n=1 Tax=Streptomyces sp. NPDC057336 TaxID=3346102 RepID=UPI003635777A
MIPWLILTAAIVGPVCFTIGSRNGRVRVVVIGATAQQDEAALDALHPDDEELVTEWRAQLDRLVTPLDLPDSDDPRSSAA